MKKTLILFYLLLSAIHGLFVGYAENFFLKGLFLNIAVVFFVMTMVYAFERPHWLLKQKNGRLPWFSVLLYWPYFLLVEWHLRVFHHQTHEAPIHQVAENLYLGRHLRFDERVLLEALGIQSTLDLTSEFSEVSAILSRQRYLNIPILDTLPPTPSQLHHAIAWLESERQLGPVLVHCALGHGRSATVVVALLMKEASLRDPLPILRRIQSIRQGVELTPLQWKALIQFGKQLPLQ